MLVSAHLAHIDLESAGGGVAAVMHMLAAQIPSVKAALSTGEATLSSVEAGLKIGSFLPRISIMRWAFSFLIADVSQQQGFLVRWFP